MMATHVCMKEVIPYIHTKDPATDGRNSQFHDTPHAIGKIDRRCRQLPWQASIGLSTTSVQLPEREKFDCFVCKLQASCTDSLFEFCRKSTTILEFRAAKESRSSRTICPDDQESTARWTLVVFLKCSLFSRSLIGVSWTFSSKRKDVSIASPALVTIDHLTSPPELLR